MPVLRLKIAVDEYGIQAIIKEIEKCNTAIIPFVKNPSKQNFYEKTACTMIDNMRGIKNFHKLSNQSTYVCNGSIIERTELRIYPSAKIIDFRWEYKGYKIYDKYTKDSGGSTTNTEICKNLSNKVENYPKQFLSR